MKPVENNSYSMIDAKYRPSIFRWSQYSMQVWGVYLHSWTCTWFMSLQLAFSLIIKHVRQKNEFLWHNHSTSMFTHYKTWTPETRHEHDSLKMLIQMTYVGIRLSESLYQYIGDQSQCIFPIHVSLISHGQFKYLYNNNVITLIFAAWLTQFIAFSDGDNGAEIFNYFVMDFSTCIHYIYAITVPLTIITCRHYIAFFNDLVAILQLQKNSIRFQ